MLFFYCNFSDTLTYLDAHKNLITHIQTIFKECDHSIYLHYICLEYAKGLLLPPHIWKTDGISQSQLAQNILEWGINKPVVHLECEPVYNET